MDTAGIIQTIDAEIASLEKTRALLNGHTRSPKRVRPVSSKPAAKTQRRKMSAEGRARRCSPKSEMGKNERQVANETAIH
jgi:hypothetical protein